MGRGAGGEPVGEEPVQGRRLPCRREVTETVGNNSVPFNQEATRWLGVWLVSQLTLKEHHAVRMKSGRKAMARLHWLTG